MPKSPKPRRPKHRPESRSSDRGADRYMNRELSWIQFNARVLGEALDTANPLLERLKFIAIVSSNYDEFFMVRVAGLKRQQGNGDRRIEPAGMRPSEQLAAIRRRTLMLVRQQYRCLHDELLPALAEHGLRVLSPEDYSAGQRRFATELFEREIFHTLTPRAVDDDEALPISGNRLISLAFLLRARSGEDAGRRRLAIVQVPQILDRLHRLPTDGPGDDFALVEDIIRINAEHIFPGCEIDKTAVFRVTRDADLSVDEQRDEDFLQAMTEVLLERERSRPVRLEISCDSPRLGRRIAAGLSLSRPDIYDLPGPLDLKSLMKLAFLPGYDALRNPEWPPMRPPVIPDDITELWDVLKKRDILLHHPYDSFAPLVELLQAAAVDPGVLVIKIVLYRTSGDSPIIKALSRAARNGKQVTAVVELKARFDEGQNIGWAEQLERAGVIVVHGIARLKIHAKATLIVRRERLGVCRYIHLGTGNYNDSTAKLYTDLGLLSAREELSYETTLFFNAVTGYSAVPGLHHLMMAPSMLRPRFTELIEREISRSSPHNPGLIMAKLNSLYCPKIADLLYRASRAGVKVLLNIRGICILRPGKSGLSENIRVVSIVDRFLEHSRIFYFRNGGDDEVYLGSADWMRRNLDRRVELAFPIYSPDVKARVVQALECFFRDNTKSHELGPDGRYRKRQPRKDEPPFRSQAEFYRQARLRAEAEGTGAARELVVRRTGPSPD